jgi:hypothetical protein
MRTRNSHNTLLRDGKKGCQILTLEEDIDFVRRRLRAATAVAGRCVEHYSTSTRTWRVSIAICGLNDESTQHIYPRASTGNKRTPI